MNLGGMQFNPQQSPSALMHTLQKKQCTNICTSYMYEGKGVVIPEWGLSFKKVPRGFVLDDYLLDREAKVRRGSCTKEAANAKAKG